MLHFSAKHHIDVALNIYTAEITWVGFELTPANVAQHRHPTKYLQNIVKEEPWLRLPLLPGVNRCPYQQWEAKVVAQARKGPVSFYIALHEDPKRSAGRTFNRAVWIHSAMGWKTRPSGAKEDYEGWGFDHV